MLARILKDDGLLSLLLTALAAVGLIVFRASNGSSGDVSADALSMHWALSWSGGVPWVTNGLCVLLLLTLGVVTRQAGIRFRLLSSKGWLPILITVCIGLLSTDALQRPDILLGALASQLTVVLILTTYRQDSVLSTLFHAGMLLGVGILFHGPSILMLAVILFSIFILRPGAWREWLMPVMGLIMLFIMVMVVLIWIPDPMESLRKLLLSAWVVTISGPQPHAGHMVLAVLLVLALPGLLQDITSGAVQTRNGMLVMLSLLAVAVGMAFIPTTLRTEAVTWAAFPLGVALSVLLERANRWWLADALLAALVVAVLLGQLP